jgi:hypothetical protein
VIPDLLIFLAVVALFVTAASAVRRRNQGPRRGPWTDHPTRNTHRGNRNA